jgi:ferritin-like metal-binding protein YciE
LLQTTLNEEHAINDHLTLVAESYINEDAKEEGQEG